jgi:hypothetical protein
LICEEETAVAVSPVGTEGGVVSGAAWVVVLAALDCAERLPAASKAATV